MATSAILLALMDGTSSGTAAWTTALEFLPMIGKIQLRRDNWSWTPRSIQRRNGCGPCQMCVATDKESSHDKLFLEKIKTLLIAYLLAYVYYTTFHFISRAKTNLF